MSGLFFCVIYSAFKNIFVLFCWSKCYFFFFLVINRISYNCLCLSWGLLVLLRWILDASFSRRSCSFWCVASSLWVIRVWSRAIQWEPQSFVASYSGDDWCSCRSRVLACFPLMKQMMRHFFVPPIIVERYSSHCCGHKKCYLCLLLACHATHKLTGHLVPWCTRAPPAMLAACILPFHPWHWARTSHQIGGHDETRDDDDATKWPHTLSQ